MWGGLWLLSVSWRTPGQGLERVGASWAGGQGLVSAFGGGGPHGSSGFHCAKAHASAPTVASVSQVCASRVCVGTCAEEDTDHS